MTKRSAVKNSLIFSTILVVMLYLIEKVIDFGVRKSSYSHYYKINVIMDGGVDPEIAIFGSSVGEVGINAALLEVDTKRSAYNFSIDGTRFMQYRGLIREFDQYSKSCKLVIFVETFFSLMHTDQLTEVNRYISHISNHNIYQSLSGIDASLSWKLKYIPFYKFIVMNPSYYKASAFGLANWMRKQDLTFRDSLRGYTPKYQSWDPSLDELNKRTNPIHIQIDTGILKKYRNTLAELRSKGRVVVIILPPIHADGLRLLPDMDNIRSAFASLAGDGVHFVDYSDSPISQDKAFFYNNTHLNNTGAERFSVQLASDIKKLSLCD
jgi:hypothetical protein